MSWPHHFYAEEERDINCLSGMQTEAHLLVGVSLMRWVEWVDRTLPSQVKGDAFLARVFDNGDDFERLDLNLSEVTSDAQWVKDAAAQNAQRREQVGRHEERGKACCG